jgi:hypothetical protein
MEGMQGRRSDPFRTGISRGWFGWLAWGALVVVIAAFWKREATPFIYFQF